MKCPECQFRSMGATFDVCPKCAAVTGGSTVVPATSPIKCPHCGSFLASHRTQCIWCGQSTAGASRRVGETRLGATPVNETTDARRAWYRIKDRKKLGPLTDDDLRRLAESEELRGSDLVWRVGLSDWTAADEVLDFLRPPPLPVSTKQVSPRSDSIQDLELETPLLKNAQHILAASTRDPGERALVGARTSQAPRTPHPLSEDRENVKRSQWTRPVLIGAAGISLALFLSAGDDLAFRSGQWLGMLAIFGLAAWVVSRVLPRRVRPWMAVVAGAAWVLAGVGQHDYLNSRSVDLSETAELLATTMDTMASAVENYEATGVFNLNFDDLGDTTGNKVMATVQQYLSRVALIRSETDRRLSALPLDDVFETKKLRSRATIRVARSAAKSALAILDDFEEGWAHARDVARLRFALIERQQPDVEGLVEGFNAGASEAQVLLNEWLLVERAVYSLMEEVMAFLDRQFATYEVTEDQVLFATDADVLWYNAALDSLGVLVTREEQVTQRIQEGSLRRIAQ